MNKVKWMMMASCLVMMVAFLPAQAKIGFVDSNRAVVSTDEGKAEYQKIVDWAKSQDDQMQEMRKRMEDRQTQLRNGQNTLADDKKDELIKEIEALDTEMKRRAEDLKKEYNRQLEEFGKKMDRKITPLFNKFAQDSGYTLILYLNPQVIAYFDQQADLTEQVIKLYNQTYPFQAAAPAPKTGGK